MEHLKMYLRCYTEKMGQFELSEPKNLCYTSSNFAFWNYFPQEPVFCITGSCSLTSMLAAGALLVLRIVPHSARSQTLQARSFLGMLGPFLCTPCVRGQEVHSAHSIKPKICRTLSSEMFQSLTQRCKTR